MIIYVRLVNTLTDFTSKTVAEPVWEAREHSIPLYPMLETSPLNTDVTNEWNTCQIIFQTSLYVSVISLDCFVTVNNVIMHNSNYWNGIVVIVIMILPSPELLFLFKTYIYMIKGNLNNQSSKPFQINLFYINWPAYKIGITSKCILFSTFNDKIQFKIFTSQV